VVAADHRRTVEAGLDLDGAIEGAAHQQDDLFDQIAQIDRGMAAMGLSRGLMDESSHRIIMAVIALSLLLSPLWMMMIKNLIRRGMLD